MAFVYDEQNHQAIDPDTGETVSGPCGYTDIGGVFPYRYTAPRASNQPPLEFYLRFSGVRVEPIIDNKPIDINTIEIDELNLRTMFLQRYAYPEPAPAFEASALREAVSAWDAFKHRIADGTLAIVVGSNAENDQKYFQSVHYHVRKYFQSVHYHVSWKRVLE